MRVIYQFPKTYSVFIFLLLIAISVSAQATFPNRTLSFFTSMWKNIPQEKVYLHTDKPYYSAGEDIWFKAYVINAATHFPDTKSKFVYVELINAFDSVLIRAKIRKDSIGFSGHLNLNTEIAAGDYVLRAYTYWMQNTGVDYFFNKHVKIGNSIDDRLFSSIQFGEIANGFQSITIQLRDAASKPIVGKVFKVNCTGSKNAIKPVQLKSNQQGEIQWRIPLDTTFNAKKFITLSTDEPSLKFTKQFTVPPFTSDFDVQFFPESGSLLHDNVRIVAFKAIGSDGLSVNVTGKIFDDQNNEITDMNSVYKGMGKFSVFARAGISYYALVKNENGIEKRFSLPKVDNHGVSLQLVYNKAKIFYDIKNQLPDLHSPLYLLIHCRGVICAIQPLTFLSGQINEVNLPAGITSFSVVDTLGNVFCERLYFVKNSNLYNINISSDKKAYKKREEVKLNFFFQIQMIN